MTEPQKVTTTATGASAGLVGKKLKTVSKNKFSTIDTNCPPNQILLVRELTHFLNDVLITKPVEHVGVSVEDVWSALCLSHTKLESIRGN